MKLNNPSDKPSVSDELQSNTQNLSSKYIDEEKNCLNLKNIKSTLSRKKCKEYRCYVIGILCIFACFMCAATIFIILKYNSAGTF